MNLAYVRGQLETALRVARLDRDAVRDFDQSIDGFFRSFYGIILCAPAYVFIILAERRMAASAVAEFPADGFLPPPPISLGYLTLETLIYVVYWLSFPVAMIFLARLIGAGSRYVPFVVAYNWTNCIVLFATVLPYLFYLAGIVPIAGAFFLSFPILLFALSYRWIVAVESLETTAMTAVGIVLFDFLLGLFVELGGSQLRLFFLGAP
jgi:hypothetical protein